MILGTPKGDVPIASAAKPSNPWLAYSTLAQDTLAGRDVTPSSALALNAVYGAISLIANGCGMLPCETIDTKATGKGKLVTAGRLAPMLRHQPNEDMSGVDYWTLVFNHLLSWGNHYAAKLRGPDGYVRELYPLLPESVHPFRDAQGRKLFRVATYDGATFVDQVFTKRDIWHVMGPSFDAGLTGASPIAVQRYALGVATAQAEYQSRFYMDGSALKGYLSTEQRDLSPEAADRIKAQWRARHSGLSNAHDVPVLHSGLKFEATSISPEDAQLVESMKWSATQIATMYGLPASRLNTDGGHSNRYANMAQDDLHVVKSAYLPRILRVEAALNMDADLFGPMSPWVPKFNIAAAERADQKSRFDAYSVAIRDGWLLRSEVREAEDMDPVAGIDDQPVAPAAPAPAEGNASDTAA